MDKNTRLKVYEKYGGHCAYCGECIAYKDMQVDHIKPLCRGLDAYDKEKDLFENYNPSCRSCNFRKGMLTIEDFRKVIKNGLNVLNRNFTFRLLKKYGLIAEQKKEVKFFFECMEEEMKLCQCWGCGRIKKCSRAILAGQYIWVCVKCEIKFKEMLNEVR